MFGEHSMFNIVHSIDSIETSSRTWKQNFQFKVRQVSTGAQADLLFGLRRMALRENGSLRSLKFLANMIDQKLEKVMDFCWLLIKKKLNKLMKLAW